MERIEGGANHLCDDVEGCPYRKQPIKLRLIRDAHKRSLLEQAAEDDFRDRCIRLKYDLVIMWVRRKKLGMTFQLSIYHHIFQYHDWEKLREENDEVRSFVSDLRVAPSGHHLDATFTQHQILNEIRAERIQGLVQVDVSIPEHRRLG